MSRQGVDLARALGIGLTAPRVDPLNALRVSMAVLVKAGTPETLYVADAHRKHLTGECPDLMKSLGLRPPRGGRYKTPLEQERFRARNGLIAQSRPLLPGRCRGDKAAALHACLVGELDPNTLDPSGDLASIVKDLAALNPPGPTQLARIMKEFEGRGTVDTHPLT